MVCNFKSLVACSVLCAVLLLVLIILGQLNLLSVPCVCVVCYALYHNLSC
jgi:hypothetical protein